ncbi:uncharacterized protein LOC116289233 [Actinia tenebrosa]|uniref:Uncharacterized protein LOC116289233 n=1 Tax=Actinia tenebrosa TaxID=6105 RepID=A0A6P8H9Z6_ACTTE|nr:uncharacterized protein LOC116289233 [Actinia tenebrosa]
MTSSTAYNSTTSPSKARLNYTAGSSWCAAANDSSPYLQINLGSPYIICGIATQGDHMSDQWVQSYNMLTSNDGTAFTKYTENSQVKSFVGNFDSSNTAVKNLLYDGTVSQYIRVAPTSHYGSTNCMRTELYGIRHDGGCTSMFVGLSYSSIIPDHRFSASSYYDLRYKPHFARLSTSSKAWGPRTTSGAWLQIDLGSVVFVCAVATQGAGADLTDEFVRKYKIQVSLDNVNWNHYQENNGDKEFTGNTDRSTVVTNKLKNPVRAKFIRFYPIDYRSHPTMRAEVYGISSACSSLVGLEAPGIIQDSQMTSSSNLDSDHTASHGRLYGSSAWCSSTSSNTQYIQINLGQVMTVTGIATQGVHTMDKWVRTYTISYSTDGNLWSTYKAGSNSDKILEGNSDKENVRVQWLSHPLTARHVRVTPQTWNTAICMRLELYVCDYVTRQVIVSGLINQSLTASSNSYVDLVCSVREPLIQYIKWYTGNTDITTQSTGLVHGANGGKKSTLRVNYTSADYILSTYDCHDSVCSKAYVCRAMYENTKNTADGIRSAGVTVKLDYPSIPTVPTVHDIKSTSVTVRWIQPALNASQASVTSYVLQYQNITHTQTISVSSPATSHVITGLAIYANYSVQIKAISGIGPGQWSATKNFRTLSDIPVGFPNSVKAVAQTSQSIRVAWQAPTSGINGPLRGYRIFCRSGSDIRKSTATPQQTSHTFSGLRKWTVYNVTVVIRNDKGDGPIHSYVLRRTFEDAPGQPQSFQVTVLSSTAVRLNWTLPRETNGIIRGFKLHYEKTGKSSEKDLSGNTTRSYVLTGLSKCTLYSFKMLAYTIKDGVLTASKQKETAEDAPSAPLKLETKIIQPNAPSVPQVTLTWSKPAVCGDNVLHYKVSYNRDVDPTLKGETVDQSKLTVTIPVWGGVTYKFRVKGVTNKEGPDTPTKTVVIPIYCK